MIRGDYKSLAIQAVLGPNHSALIPEFMYAGWADAAFVTLSNTGIRVEHNDLVPESDGVTNSTDIDGGTSPATVPTYFVFLDASTGGTAIAFAPATFTDGSGSPATPVSGDPIMIPAGALTFTYAA